MKLRLLLSFTYVFISIYVSKAQYFEDAYRFSNTNYGLGSTARIQALGGTQLALGGDISSATSNPAGLGFFNKSVVLVTPSLNLINTDTDYSIIRPNETVTTEKSDEAFSTNFNFANLGAVFYFGKGRFSDDKYKGGSLAISFSRNNSFHLKRTYEGENGFNSIIDGVIQQAGANATNNLNELGLATFDQFLITPNRDAMGNIQNYNSLVGGFPIQRETIKERGSNYHFNVAWGGNYNDKLYFGGGINLQLLRYNQDRKYEEFDFLRGGVDTDSLNAIQIDNKVTVKGRGVSVNLGVIYRPFHFLTIGASYISPSFMSIKEESTLDLDANWDNGSSYSEEVDGVTETYDLSTINPYKSNLIKNEYELRTPSKIGVGMALFIGKLGFLSADLEYIDYSNAKINSDDFSTSQDSDLIKTTYESVFNIRAGGEYRLNNFTLRGGYAFFPDPVKNSSIQDRTNITFGLGYRTFDYYIDVAVISSRSKTQATPYFIDSETISADLSGQPIATSEIKNTTISLTFGLNF